MAQDINKVGISEEMLDADYFLASIDGKLRRFKKEDLLKALLMKSGDTMAGAINMDGNAITGIPDAEGDTDALALAFAKTLFAPSGYGYGEALPTVTGPTDAEFLANIEALCEEKTKYSTFQAILYPPGDAFDGNSFVAQIFHNIDSSGKKFIKIKAHATTSSSVFQRVCYGSTWDEPEWENPPMKLGVEYRTTERHDGKVVYAKYYDAGKMLNNTLYSLPSGATDVVRMQAFTSRGHLLPVGQFIKDDTSSGYFAYATTNSGANGVYAFTDTRTDGYGNGSYNMYIKLRYTKE